jgi:hypothetical protein
MTTKKQPQETAATAKFPLSHKTSAQLVDSTNKIADIVKANAAYANTPDMQQAVTAWQASAGVVQQNDHDIKAAHVALLALIAARHAAVAAWKRSTKKILATVNDVSVGSAKTIKDWGFDINTRSTPVAASGPPDGLRLVYDKKLEPIIRWKGVRGQLGYQIQIGDGTPTGWGTPLMTTQRSLKPTGLQPGQHVAIRIAVTRKTGLSTWSDTITAVIR